ncbi:hypothetical protein RF11_16010 [Thelohanellus kitauei]|uniref:Transposase Tc1-like domain-containing protein n=1 Tax=Thelohanellus kitauei TaxID=669202 RepID=A0A0C2MHE0_THEKT|nr:hypothetical protein RF11_16010 [Thelohanellus kitauei]
MSSNDNSKKSMSLDIKKIIMNLVIEEGKPESGVSRTLRITGTTVRSFLKKYETSDRIEADQRGGRRHAKITLEIEHQIRQLVAYNCTTTIQGIINTLDLDVCHTTVWRSLKKNNYSWKMTRPIPEKRNDPEIKAERREYVLWYQSILPHLRYSHIVYVDESPIYIYSNLTSGQG